MNEPQQVGVRARWRTCLEPPLREDSLSIQGTEIFVTYQGHNEAIVIPETIDAIRAMTELEQDGARSTAKTDADLGIRKDLLTGAGRLASTPGGRH